MLPACFIIEKIRQLRISVFSVVVAICLVVQPTKATSIPSPPSPNFFMDRSVENYSFPWLIKFGVIAIENVKEQHHPEKMKCQ